MTASWSTTAAVLRLTALGRTARAIGREMHFTEQAVSYHTAKLFRLLGVHNGPALVAKAYAAGLLSGWPPHLDEDKWLEFVTKVEDQK